MPPSNSVNRVLAGKRGAGRYDFKHNTEADLDLVDESVNPYDILSAIRERVQLVTASPEDHLSEHQINDALRGDWNMVDESVSESYSGPRYAAAYALACEEIDVAYEGGRFGKSSFELDESEVAQAVRGVLERDAGAPVDSLVSQTPPQVLRSSLGRPADRMGDLPDRYTGESFYDDRIYAARVNVVAGILKEHGMDTDNPETSEAIHDLVTNGPTFWNDNVKLDVMWKGKVADATVCPRGEEEAGWREVTFDSPDVLLLDPKRGDGYLVMIPGKVRQTLTPDSPAFLDSSGKGVGWSDCFDYAPEETSLRTTDWL